MAMKKDETKDFAAKALYNICITGIDVLYVICIILHK